MERNVKRCCTNSRLLRLCSVDRLSSLPDELLGQILSRLPTKDVAAMQVLSKRMRPAFSWITSVDIVDSSVHKCYKAPLLADRLPLFESFIDNVLDKLSPDQSLTRFKLRLGGDFSFRCFGHYYVPGHSCFPSVKPARFNRWTSYPLANCGLRELHLSLYIGNPSECKLPPQFFDCQSLEVLCLDSSMEFGDGVEFQRICLPNLKILRMHSLIFNEGDFITRLVSSSSCPVLEELVISCRVRKKLDRVVIRSDSLRRLDLAFDEFKRERPCNSNLVVIDTPNLLYFKYRDNLSHRYSIPYLNALVEAHIHIDRPLPFDGLETSARIQLSLLSALSNVQHLSLHGWAAQILNDAGELNDPLLPVFRNLKTLDLGPFRSGRWDIPLLLILRFSPFLETLVFSKGFFHMPGLVYVNPCDHPHMKASVLEAEGWRTTKVMPSCFRTHLKRIELKSCFGYKRELAMIKFLVSKAAVVLTKFVTSLRKETGIIDLTPGKIKIDGPDLDEFERTLDNLPRASDSCSIIVSR